MFCTCKSKPTNYKEDYENGSWNYKKKKEKKIAVWY